MVVKKRFALLKIMMVLCAMTTSGFSQSTTILDEFSASENNGTVYLYWIISSGSTCDGIKIFRSVDNLNFTQIGEIGGVCGSSSAPQPYSFVDENPQKNRTNYYRLELGYSGYSETIFLEITDLNEKGYQVRPNPVVDEAHIVFQNDLRKSCSITLYNLIGRKTASQSTKETSFNIGTLNLNNGMYVFIISSADNQIKIKGKIIVQH